MRDDGQPGRRGPQRRPLPDRDETVLLTEGFTAATVTALRHRLTTQVAAAGLTGDTADDFVLAVHELVTNAVRHGGGTGTLHLTCRDSRLRCAVTDHGTASGSLAVGRPATDVPGGRGLWLAHHLTGALMLDRRPDGVTATVTARLTGSVDPPTAPRFSSPRDPAL